MARTSDRDRLRHILEALDKIIAHTPGARSGYDADEVLAGFILYNLTVVGEAAARLSQATRDRHPAIEWAKIIGMRNVLTHNYMGVDAEVIWNTVASDVPALRRQLARALEEDKG